MATYVTFCPHNQQWKFQFKFNGHAAAYGKPERSRWLPLDKAPPHNTPTAKGKAIAESAADRKACEDLRAWFKTRTPAELTDLELSGGIVAAQAVAKLAPPRELIAVASMVPTTPEQAWNVVQARHVVDDMHGRVATARALVLKSEPASDYALANLFNIWRDAKPRTRTDKHTRALKSLVAFLGNVDFREVTRPQVEKWRNHLHASGRSHSDQKEHLRPVSAMFAAAMARERDAFPNGNPCHEVEPLGEENTTQPEHKQYTVAELTAMLNYAPAFGKLGWGAAHHDAALWVFKLVAYTMARPVEITGLRKSLVKRDGASVVLLIQSKKTGKQFRRVPLHRDIAESFYAWAMAQKTDDVFECFRIDPVKKTRTVWFSDNFKLLRDGAGVAASVDGSDYERTMYDMRSTAISQLERHKVDSRMSDYLSGHAAKDVKGKRYIARDVADLQAAMDLIKPFA